MPTYNKLVRDKIPEVIYNTGKTCRVRTLSDEDYLIELQKKCKEELEEYLSSSNNEEAVEELADLLELIHTLASVHGLDPEKLEEIRLNKAYERGGFQEKLFLIDVSDE
jgi:predicted house-cleaning noncanonical NTP pyrophosphatase (MazG superfamily)